MAKENTAERLEDEVEQEQEEFSGIYHEREPCKTMHDFVLLLKEMVYINSEDEFREGRVMNPVYSLPMYGITGNSDDEDIRIFFKDRKLELDDDKYHRLEAALLKYNVTMKIMDVTQAQLELVDASKEPTEFGDIVFPGLPEEAVNGLRSYVILAGQKYSYPLDQLDKHGCIFSDYMYLDAGMSNLEEIIETVLEIGLGMEVKK